MQFPGKQPNAVIIGTQYYRAPLPERQEWEKDVLNIKHLGMNTVKLFPQWRWHERIRGRFTWDDTDELFDLCAANGLAVYVNVILDTAPDWAIRDGHGARVTNKGEPKPVTAAGCRYPGGWEPCFDDPFIRVEAERFLTAIVERYKDRESLIAWDIWNEPRNRWGDCACAESQKRYREWLADKYGSVEQLNDAFGKAWASFDDVVPPPLLSDYAEMYLWRQWAMHSIADRVAWAAEVARAADPAHTVMAHAGGCSMIQDVMDDTCEDWRVSRGVDVYGSSLAIVEAPATSTLQRAMPGLHCDWLKNLTDEYWIAEFYPDKGGWRPPPPADEIRLQLWSTLAHGAKKILFWQYRAERVGNESNGHGLVALDGGLTDRAEEVRKITEVVGENQDLFAECRPAPAEVALVYDERSDLISRIESTVGYSYTSNGSYPYFHNYKGALQGSYALFWENNIPVDVISIHDVHKLPSYRVVYLPAPLVVDDAYARELAAFVRQGGVLVSEASLGLRLPNTWLRTTNPPDELKDVFGAQEESRVQFDEPRTVAVPSYGLNLPATRLVTHLRPATAAPCGFWDDGTPALTMNHCSDGKAVLLGFYAGASFIDSGDEAFVSFTRLLMKDLGVAPPLRLNAGDGGVQFRVLERTGEQLVILLNYNEETSDCDLDLSPVAGRPCEDLRGNAGLEETESGVRLRLPPREACLIRRPTPSTPQP